MNRRVWTGVIAGVVAATVLLTVGIGSYRAGQDHEVVTRTVGDGEVVRVVGHPGWGFFPGFFLFPLLLIVLIVVLARRSWGYGWHRPYGPGPGPGYYRGPGGPGWYGGPDERMREWHRRMHEGEAGEAEGDVPSGPDDPGPSGPTRPTGAPGSDPSESGGGSNWPSTSWGSGSGSSPPTT